MFDNILAFIWEYVILYNPIVKAIHDGFNAVASFFGFKTEEKVKYTIKIMPYIDEVMKFIENEGDKIKTEAEKYIEFSFEQKVERYFQALDSYLGNYRNELEQSLKDKNLPLQKLEELKQALDSFADGTDKLEIDNLIEKSNNLLENTKRLLPKR